MRAEACAAAIEVLAPEIAARIAAGEVIERPASVVKELVENALDAGARRIEITLQGGGLELIRVADDGAGIPSAEVELAFARHGTSKLRHDAELTRLHTLGFRGEALPSIAAVADVICQTRAVVESLGLYVCMRGGQMVAREARARQPGTTVTVEDLFGDLPARRTFMRSRGGEAGVVAQVVGHLALARPDVAFRLVSDGRQVLATPGDADLRTAALAVRGPSFERQALDLGPVELVGARGQPLGRLHGLLGPTAEQRATRSGLSLFVNGRWVQNRTLAAAVEDGYRTLVRTGMHPVALLFLEVPPERVDVNVHPTKSEVRLMHEGELFPPIRSAVQAGLLSPQRLWDEAAPDGEQIGLGIAGEGLRVLGQAGGTYIVAEGALGLYLVDQHAAHERILLDELRQTAGARTERQQLLTPEVVDIPEEAAREPEEVCTALQALGFAAEPFGSASVLIRALPAILAERRALAGLAEALTLVGAQAGSPSWQDRLSVELACKTAIKAGDVLSAEEMLGLVRRLGETVLGETCAHGRPTSLLLSHTQLARQFGRT